MGKNAPTPPSNPFKLLPPVPDEPGQPQAIPVGPSDPDVEKILGQIKDRQLEDQKKSANLTPSSLAFSLMRSVPRSEWGKKINTRGENTTPGNLIIKLFDLDTKLKAKADAKASD